METYINSIHIHDITLMFKEYSSKINDLIEINDIITINEFFTSNITTTEQRSFINQTILFMLTESCDYSSTYAPFEIIMEFNHDGHQYKIQKDSNNNKSIIQDSESIDIPLKNITLGIFGRKMYDSIRDYIKFNIPSLKCSINKIITLKDDYKINTKQLEPILSQLADYNKYGFIVDNMTASPEDIKETLKKFETHKVLLEVMNNKLESIINLDVDYEIIINRIDLLLSEINVDKYTIPENIRKLISSKKDSNGLDAIYKILQCDNSSQNEMIDFSKEMSKFLAIEDNLLTNKIFMEFIKSTSEFVIENKEKIKELSQQIDKITELINNLKKQDVEELIYKKLYNEIFIQFKTHSSLIDSIKNDVEIESDKYCDKFMEILSNINELCDTDIKKELLPICECIAFYNLFSESIDSCGTIIIDSEVSDIAQDFCNSILSSRIKETYTLKIPNIYYTYVKETQDDSQFYYCESCDIKVNKKYKNKHLNSKKHTN